MLAPNSGELIMSVRIESVNGMRGLAALSIFYMHTLSQFTPPGTLALGPVSLGTVLSCAWVGVNFFFVLSGFVLYLPYADGNRIGIADFYRRRWLRLMPLLYLNALVCVALYSGYNVLDHDLWMICFHTLLATFFFNSTYPEIPGNGPLWSISVEFWMSAAFPLLVTVARRWGFWRVCAALFLLTMLARLTEHGIFSTFILGRAGVFLHSLNEFMLGVILAHVYRRHEDFLVGLRRYAPLALAVGIALIVMVFHIHVRVGHTSPPITACFHSRSARPGSGAGLRRSDRRPHRFPEHTADRVAVAALRHDVLFDLYLAHAASRPLCQRDQLHLLDGSFPDHGGDAGPCPGILVRYLSFRRV
ncbi:MAG: acyltransferase, partial [Candidatus Competibacteraceae bacterium]|nr:acyltransferase [Candidatus Competibacteraceae bacterium]